MAMLFSVPGTRCDNMSQLGFSYFQTNRYQHPAPRESVNMDGTKAAANAWPGDVSGESGKRVHVAITATNLIATGIGYSSPATKSKQPVSRRT
jgi:hypothetical protein